MKTNLYILALLEGKYFVGLSNDPYEAFQYHLQGNGPTWTVKYKPIYILDIIKDVPYNNEDKFVKEYMVNYGMNNVRGGIYITETLSDFQQKTLLKEIWRIQGKCIHCGDIHSVYYKCSSSLLKYDTIYEENEDNYCNYCYYCY